MRGTYCLVISVLSDIELRVGAIGVKAFSSGTYIYVGSALNGLEARVNRHIRTSLGAEARLHWHIDYLLRKAEARIEEVWFKEAGKGEECLIARTVSAYGLPVSGFGCSDCDCVSHLFKVESPSFLGALRLRPWKGKIYASDLPCYHGEKRI